MAIYRLWRASEGQPFDQVDARDDAHAVNLFSGKLGIELTLKEGLFPPEYLMDIKEPNMVRLTGPPGVPVWVKEPVKSN